MKVCFPEHFVVLPSDKYQMVINGRSFTDRTDILFRMNLDICPVIVDEKLLPGLLTEMLIKMLCPRKETINTSPYCSKQESLQSNFDPAQSYSHNDNGG